MTPSLGCTRSQICVDVAGVTRAHLDDEDLDVVGELLVDGARDAIAITALFTAACGVRPPPRPAKPFQASDGQTVVVATAPVETSVVPGTSVRFTAQVTGTASTTVKWSVDEADGGTIDANGLYTAPAIEGTFHVTTEQASPVTTNARPRPAPRKGHWQERGARLEGRAVGRGEGEPWDRDDPSGWVDDLRRLGHGSDRCLGRLDRPGRAGLRVGFRGRRLHGSECGATCTVAATSDADTTRSGSTAVTVTPPTAPLPLPHPHRHLHQPDHGDARRVQGAGLHGERDQLLQHRGDLDDHRGRWRDGDGRILRRAHDSGHLPRRGREPGRSEQDRDRDRDGRGGEGALRGGDPGERDRERERDDGLRGDRDDDLRDVRGAVKPPPPEIRRTNG